MASSTTTIGLVSFIVGLTALFYTNILRVSRFLVERNFNRFPYGTLCLEYSDNNNNIIRYGKNKLSSECTIKLIINNSEQFFYALVFRGERGLGIGEAYVEGLWDVAPQTDLGDAMSFLASNIFSVPRPFVKTLLLYLSPEFIKNKIERYSAGSHEIEADRDCISHHYDLGNDLYSSFLEETMMYSCAIWSREANTLTKAQLNKLNVLYKKLDIPSESENTNGDVYNVLDIGSGWGYFPNYISSNNKYTNVTGISISDNQIEYSINRFGKNCKLPNCPSFINRDYRLLNEYENSFDRIVSIGMLEHVGLSKLPEFFESVTRYAKPDTATFVLHYISQNPVYPESFFVDRFNPCGAPSFVSKYIFPGGCLLYPESIVEYGIKYGWNEIHREYFGIHYARTLRQWRINLDNSWDELKLNNPKYDNRLKRIYDFYIAQAESSFRAGIISLVQHVFTNTNISWNNPPQFETVVNPNTP